MIKEMNWFVRLLTPKWATAITLAPFGIYIRKERLCSITIRNHEMIHWKQQLEMFIVPFYLWYLIEWIVKLFKYGGQSYANISFERAAYIGDDRAYSWIKYL